VKKQAQIEEQMAAQIAGHGLLAGVRRLGVAVSGGSDSVALLRLLLPFCRAAKIKLVVLHLDHGLRGAASATDARFVARLAKRLGVACRMRSAERGARSAEPGTRSPEMAAREMRQKFFREAAQEERLDAIATGHTADDVAETLLLRLMRGSGATGLSGLRPCHTVAGVKFVRPLLASSHADLRAWLRRQGQRWQEDASNRDERIPRNRLRRTVLPWLERHWSPSIRAMLAQSAAILREEDALLEEITNYEFVIRNSKFVIKKNLPLALQRRAVRRWLIEAGYPAAAGWDEVERLLACAREKKTWQVSLPSGLLARGQGSRIELRPGRAGPPQKIVAAAVPAADSAAFRRTQPSCDIPIPGTIDVAGVRVTARRAKGIVRTQGPVGALPSACSLDADALRGKTLQVRTRQPGDRIRPLGLDGSKTLQDLLVDAKVLAARRDKLPLLVVDNELVWIPGYRVSQAYAVRGPRAAAVRVEMKVMGHSSLGKIGRIGLIGRVSMTDDQ